MSRSRPDPLGGVTTAAYRGRQRAVQHYDEGIEAKARGLTRIYKRDGGLIVAVTLLSGALCLSAAGNIWQGSQGIREVPYVLLIDHLGQERPLMRVEELPVTPEQSQVIGVLMTWVELVRSVPGEAVQLGKNWEKVEAYSSNAALGQLREYRAEQKQRQQFGRRVEIVTPSILPIKNSRSYAVEWEEKTYNQEGRVMPEESGRWKATLTIADFHSQAARQERELRAKKRQYRNILGIVVDGVSWQVRPLLSQPQPPAEGG
jgi:type IV secretory pathway TrbF-like protein